MKTPYIKALNFPSALDPEFFRKNETVIGTIGNTQGVRSIANPQRIASMISAQRPFLPSLAASGSSIAVP